MSLMLGHWGRLYWWWGGGEVGTSQSGDQTRWVCAAPGKLGRAPPGPVWPPEPVSDRPVSVAPTVQLSSWTWTMSPPPPSPTTSPTPPAHHQARNSISASNIGGFFFGQQERQTSGQDRSVDMTNMQQHHQPTIKVCSNRNICNSVTKFEIENVIFLFRFLSNIKTRRADMASFCS